MPRRAGLGSHGEQVPMRRPRTETGRSGAEPASRKVQFGQLRLRGVSSPGGPSRASRCRASTSRRRRRPRRRSRPRTEGSRPAGPSRSSPRRRSASSRSSYTRRPTGPRPDRSSRRRRRHEDIRSSFAQLSNTPPRRRVVFRLIDFYTRTREALSPPWTAWRASCRRPPRRCRRRARRRTSRGGPSARSGCARCRAPRSRCRWSASWNWPPRASA